MKSNAFQEHFNQHGVDRMQQAGVTEEVLATMHEIDPNFGRHATHLIDLWNRGEVETMELYVINRL